MNEVINEKPDHEPAKRIAAQISFDLREYRRTVELLLPLVEKDPSNVPTLELLLNSWFMLSQPEKAHGFMEKLLSENKDLAKTLKSIAFFAGSFLPVPNS